MRIALWLLALFAVAVAAALFAGSNPGSITLFWPPYRIDLSLNLVLALLVASFLTLHLAQVDQQADRIAALVTGRERHGGVLVEPVGEPAQRLRRELLDLTGETVRRHHERCDHNEGAAKSFHGARVDGSTHPGLTSR